MRKVLFFALLLLSAIAFSQAPQFLNYQAIARNGAGTIVTTPIGIKFEILQGSSLGTVVYEETNNITPSSAGVFTAAIGSGAASTGTFSAINWANSPYFIRVSIDPAGGTSYSTVGTSQLLSVPYALYAETSGNAQTFSAGNGITINSGTITNSAPNQTVNISGAGVTGSYPNYTVTSGATPTAGNGISIISGTITNTAPDQTVTISGATGTYPNFTVTSTPPTTITPGNSNISVTGADPNFTISSVPTLSLTGTQLSISNGNTVTLPTGTTYTNGAGIALTSGTIITNTAPNQTVTVSSGTNVTVNGTYPNYTVNATPTLSLSTNVLSISGGNAVTLPTPPTPTAGPGISIVSGTISNTAPNQTVNISGAGVTGSYPNYTVTSAPSTSVSSGSSNVIITGSVPSYSVIVLNPVISGAGTTTVTNAGNNYTVNSPPVSLSYLPATGVLTYSPSSGSNTINILPAVSFTNNILTVGSNTTLIGGTGLWSKFGGATYLSNATDFVGIGTTNPTQNLHIEGVNAFIRVQSTQSTTAANSIIEFGNTISSTFNSKGYVGNPGSGDHMEYEALTFHRFTTLGTERMRITNSGSVGVGTFSPFSLFDVNGKITMRTGAINGYIPVSDANGTMTWTNPTAVIPQLWSVTGNSLYPTTISNSVGIGTATPTSKLHVADVVSTGASMFVTNTVASGISGSAARFDNSGVRSIGNSGVIINNLVTKVGGSNSTKIGLEVNSTGAWGASTVNQPNVGIKVTASGADNNYGLQLVDGSQGVGKILTSDASGNASWQAPTKVAFHAGTNPVVNQSVPASVSTTITMGAGINFFNDGAGYSTATNQFTAPIPGIYQFNVHVSYTGTTTGATMQLIINTPAGFAARMQTIASGTSGDIELSTIINSAVTAGPYTIVMFSTAAFQVRPYDSHFSGALIYKN